MQQNNKVEKSKSGPLVSTSGKSYLMLGGILALAVLVLWYMALFLVTTEKHQGEVYRIIYLHVPSAFAAFFCSFALLFYSVNGLWKKTENSMLNAKAWAEIGCVFTVLTLATGSIWGKPTWGTWWTWDARLTTTFILGILYAGFLLLYSSMSPGVQRIRVCSVLGILIAADVPIIYKSVTWWRTLHQPPTLFRQGGSTMSDEIYYHLVACILSILAFAFWVARYRAKNLALESELEGLSYRQMEN